MRLKGKDILLLLLYAKGKTGRVCESVVGTTRLTKAIFLFEEEIKKYFNDHEFDDLPEFIAWNYGPWSKALIDYTEFFEGISFINIEDQKVGEDVSVAEVKEPELWVEEMSGDAADAAAERDIRSGMLDQKKYTLTQTGKSYVESKLWPNLDAKQVEVLEKFKYRINSASLFSLLRYVYGNYNKGEHNWTKNSVIKNKFL